jgi:hypothetical protein
LKVLSSVTAWLAASFSATKVLLNALVKMSRSDAIYLGSQEQNVRLKRIKVIDSDLRFLQGTEFDGQRAAEHNNSDCLGLERPANVADFLHEFHITFWQSDIGQRLWWHVRNLLKGIRNETDHENISEGGIFVIGVVLLCLVRFQDVYKPEQRQARNRSRNVKKRDAYAKAAFQTGSDFRWFRVSISVVTFTISNTPWISILVRIVRTISHCAQYVNTRTDLGGYALTSGAGEEPLMTASCNSFKGVLMAFT